MGVYSSFKNQIGRDIGKVFSNFVWGDKHASVYRRAQSRNSSNQTKFVKIDRSDDLKIIEKQQEYREFELKALRENKQFEIDQARVTMLLSSAEDNISKVIAYKIPTKKDELIEYLNLLSTEITASPCKSILKNENKITNRLSDVLLKKYEKSLLVLKLKYPKETEVVLFEQEFKEFKKTSLKGKYLELALIILGVIIFALVAIYVSANEDKSQYENGPIKSFLKSILKK